MVGNYFGQRMQIQLNVLLFLTVLILIQSVLVFCGPTKGTGSCPIKDTVKICLPKCLSDFECVGYRRCCPNSCGTMSCADVSPVSAGNDPRNPSYEGLIYCANERCLVGQKCKSEGSMKRPKCSW